MHGLRSVAVSRLGITKGLNGYPYELQPGLGVLVMKHNLKAAGIIKSARVRHPTKTIADDAEALREVEELKETLEYALHQARRDVNV